MEYRWLVKLVRARGPDSVLRYKHLYNVFFEYLGFALSIESIAVQEGSNNQIGQNSTSS